MSGLAPLAAAHLAASSPFNSETEESIRPSTRGQIETLNHTGSSSCEEPPTRTNPRILVDGSDSSQARGTSVSAHDQAQVDDPSITPTPDNTNLEMSGGIITVDQNLGLDPDNPLVSQQSAHPDQIDPIPGDSTIPADLDDDLGEETLDLVLSREMGFPHLTQLGVLLFAPAFLTTSWAIFMTSRLLRLFSGDVNSLGLHVEDFKILASTAFVLSFGGWFIFAWKFDHLWSRGLAMIIVICVMTSFVYIAFDATQTTALLFAPQPSNSCLTRVSMQQSELFTPGIYHTQFPLRGANESTANFLQRFESIQTNSTLCSIGFTGNSDLYGLGIRAGLYFQWISSVLANNFLRSEYVILQSAYHIFLIAIFVVTCFLSFSKDCIFSIEIEILYWIYWGGYVCVFLSAPNPIKLGSKPTWTGVTWNTIVILTLHIFMLCHAVWFWAWAYDYKFSRMPCGTYHFLLFPTLDPSTIFWKSRWVFTLFVLFPVSIPLLWAYFMSALLLALEIKHSVQHSVAYEAISILIPRRSQAQDQDNTRASQIAIWPFLRLHRILKARYQKFRRSFGLPGEVMPGIRLVTPVDIEQRRYYRIKCALTGLFACFVSITAIEIILRWNKIQDINSLSSVGQLFPFIIGVASFMRSVLQLVQEELKRRRDLKRRRSANQDHEGIELESIPNAITEAISHAFAQPDVDFLTNGGALPITENVVDRANTWS